jgi:hypothetical protein
MSQLKPIEMVIISTDGQAYVKLQGDRGKEIDEDELSLRWFSHDTRYCWRIHYYLQPGTISLIFYWQTAQEVVMSLQAKPGSSVPEETARVARAAFPKGSPYLTLRDELETIYADGLFAALFPKRGQPAEAPGRLALVTILEFAEGLSD